MSTKKDPLLESIDSTLRQRERKDFLDAKSKSETRTERMREDSKSAHRFFIQFALALGWVWKYLLHPIWRAISWVFRGLFRQYRKLWALTVYRRDHFDNLRLSKRRAGLFVVGTAAGLVCLYGIIGFATDTALYFTTGHHDEVMYLTNSQEVDAPGNVHAVKGCDKLPCSDSDSVYFRLNPSAFNHVWSLIHNHMLFLPDYVSAAVPPGLNRCIITTYGVRAKFLMRGLDIYPELIRASCTPVTSLHPGQGVDPIPDPK